MVLEKECKLKISKFKRNKHINRLSKKVNCNKTTENILEEFGVQTFLFCDF